MNCEKCKYLKDCMKEWGEEYQAIIGTHFCRSSWDDFLKIKGQAPKNGTL